MLIFGAIIASLFLYVSALKRIAISTELSQKEALSKHKDKANDALAKGLENEAVKPSRGYFSD